MFSPVYLLTALEMHFGNSYEPRVAAGLFGEDGYREIRNKPPAEEACVLLFFLNYEIFVVSLYVVQYKHVIS